MAKKTVQASKKRTASVKTDAKKRTPKSVPKKTVDTAKEMALRAAHYTLEKKATEVKLLDLRGITPITDFFIVCSATSDTQVKAIAENVIVKMRDEEGQAPWKSEGWDALQWVIIDFVDLVVHVFHGKARDFYHLERLWADAPMETVEDTPVKKRTTRTRKAE